jgi:hypothetical protein
MQSHIITLKGHALSERLSQECRAQAAQFGINVHEMLSMDITTWSISKAIIYDHAAMTGENWCPVILAISSATITYGKSVLPEQNPISYWSTMAILCDPCPQMCWIVSPMC